MGMTMRVSLPGYDALTDTNIDHFALYADQDYVLIKEQNRGSVSISSYNAATVSHNLGYIPYFLAFASASFLMGTTRYNGWIQCSAGGAVSPPIYGAFVDGTNLTMFNNSGSTTPFFYYIFYDQQH